jgi:hypothetical protein
MLSAKTWLHPVFPASNHTPPDSARRIIYFYAGANPYNPNWRPFVSNPQLLKHLSGDYRYATAIGKLHAQD